MSDPPVTLDADRERLLRTIGNISYLHTIVAIGAVIPGVQASVALLLAAFIIDLVKKGRRRGHLAGVALRRIRTVWGPPGCTS